MSAPRPTLHGHADGVALAKAVAQQLRDDLARSLAERGRASLVLSGGDTPRHAYERLGQASLDWRCVVVTLADERWVPADHPRSNANLVEATLRRGAAAAARFLPLYRNVQSPEAALTGIEASLRDQALPFDVVLLGMGEDGHTASLFPGARDLAAALDPQSPRLVAAVAAPGAPEPRVTMTLSALRGARRILLMLQGERKKAVFDAACAGDDCSAMPVRAILRHSAAPVDVHYCV